MELNQARKDPFYYGAIYGEHVNPQWVKLLDVLGMNVRYERCEDVELQTQDGRNIMDFLSGYCVYNMGHNHPKIVEAVSDELYRRGPGMLQSHVSDVAAELAYELCTLAGGRLNKAFFTSSGSEGVETVIKFSRAATKRTGILYCKGAFHGLTCGALSLMTDEFWREGFGPLLPDTESVVFGDLEQLEIRLKTEKFASFIVEPVQAEAGVYVPSREYLLGAQELCRKYGTLFAVDEVQTGMYRTGHFLASQHYDLDPDMVVLAKALSGGLVPCGAVLMTDRINNSVYSSLSRAFVHASTFGENSLAMRAGIASLRVMQEQNLGERAIVNGSYFRDSLVRSLCRYEMVKDVRGLGMLNGIEFTSPEKLKLKFFYNGFRKIHPGMFGMIIVMRLFREKNILTQICGNNFNVLKVTPPLTVTQAQLQRFVSSIDELMNLVHTSASFWTEALLMARRATNI